MVDPNDPSTWNPIQPTTMERSALAGLMGIHIAIMTALVKVHGPDSPFTDELIRSLTLTAETTEKGGPRYAPDPIAAADIRSALQVVGCLADRHVLAEPCSRSEH